MNISRRDLLVTGAAATLGAWSPSIIAGESSERPFPIGNTPPSEWYLWMVRRSTGEEYNEVYVRNGQLVISGYNRLCHCLRDVRAPLNEQVVQIDINLLNLLFSTQQWMKIHGQMRPLMINSGYRTIANNSRLENAARNSMHLHGRAADFFIDGLSTRYLSDLLRWFRRGGVGLYLNNRSNFVHADTGPVRTFGRIR